MMLGARRRLLAMAAVTTFVVPMAAAASQAKPFAWWKSEEFRKELQLTTDQAARIDQIFQATLPELRQEIEELSRQEAKLSRLLENNEADEAVIVRHIDRVETSRANLNKTRALMLVRMRQVLTPEQRARMRELEEAARRDGSSRSRPEAEAPKSPASF